MTESKRVKFGRYIGNVVTKWLDDDRSMELLEDFTYIDPHNQEWLAPKGSKIDGASIPRVAWTFIGGPYTGRYRNASVIHDIACAAKLQPWQSVHETFYYAMRASSVSNRKASVMYKAVLEFGPRWNTNQIEYNNTVNQYTTPPIASMEHVGNHDIVISKSITDPYSDLHSKNEMSESDLQKILNMITETNVDQLTLTEIQSIKL